MTILGNQRAKPTNIPKCYLLAWPQKSCPKEKEFFLTPNAPTHKSRAGRSWTIIFSI
jgi:hypothetical protein